MANDDQGRDVANSENATNRKPESRVREERAKENARREELHKAEQMKADTQRKAELAKAEERRTAEGRTGGKEKRGTPAGVIRKEAERRTQMARPPSKRSVCDGNSAARQKTGTRPRRSPQSRTERALAADIRRRAEAAVAERQQRQKAQQQEEQRRQTDHVRTLHRDEMHSFKENEDAAIAIHGRRDPEHRSAGDRGAGSAWCTP